MLKDLIGINDSILKIVWVGILHDDDSTAWLYLIEIEKVFVLLSNFYILAEESHIVFLEVFVLVIEFFLHEYLF